MMPATRNDRSPVKGQRTMRQDKLYLKPNTMIEPLFNQRYAWTNLIAPATSAIYITNLPRYVYAMGQERRLTYLTSIQYTDESRPIKHEDEKRRW
jgi:hypothetical protein